MISLALHSRVFSVGKRATTMRGSYTFKRAPQIELSAPTTRSKEGLRKTRKNSMIILLQKLAISQRPKRKK